MTNKEAIKAIKCNYPPENYTILREALDMAIEAIEKQIPKTPNYMPDDDTCLYYHWECPECGDYYGHSIRKGIHALYGNDVVYCSRCGQAIDWSEDDDE